MLFRALVTPCIPHCEPVQCGKEAKASYGRRKRREDEKQGEGEEGIHRMKRGTSGDDLLLANAIHILDKLQFLPGEEEEEEGEEKYEEEEEERGCSSGRAAILPISLLAAVFLLMQAMTSSLLKSLMRFLMNSSWFSHGFFLGFLMGFSFSGGPIACLESVAQLKPPNFCSGERPSLFCCNKFIIIVKCIFSLQVIINLIHINTAIMDRRVKSTNMAGAKKK